MQNRDRKQKLFVFFLIVLVGVIGVDIWQSTAKSAKEVQAESQQDRILKNIPPEEAQTLIQKHEEDKNFVILDVRTPKEFTGGHLEKAINIDFYSKTFRDKLDTLDKEHTYLIYCHSGRRSAGTLQIMEELRFNTVYNMTGGILGWIAKELPLVK